MEWSFLVEVDPGLLGHGVEAVLLDGLEGLGGEAELDVALAGLPPELLVLQVDELLLLGLVVGERHFVCPVGLLLQERADPATGSSVPFATSAVKIRHTWDWFFLYKFLRSSK